MLWAHNQLGGRHRWRVDERQLVNRHLAGHVLLAELLEQVATTLVPAVGAQPRLDRSASSAAVLA